MDITSLFGSFHLHYYIDFIWYLTHGCWKCDTCACFGSSSHKLIVNNDFGNYGQIMFLFFLL